GTGPVLVGLAPCLHAVDGALAAVLYLNNSVGPKHLPPAAPALVNMLRESVMAHNLISLCCPDDARVAVDGQSKSSTIAGLTMRPYSLQRSVPLPSYPTGYAIRGDPFGASLNRETCDLF